MSNENNNGSNCKLVYIVIIVLLLLANAFFIYRYYNTSQEKDVVVAQNGSLQDSLKALTDTLQVKIQEYEQQKGINRTLDSTIDANVAELQAKQSELNKMLKQKNWTQAEYNKAKAEIEVLRQQKDEFVARIDSLNNALKLMSQVNDSLNTNLKTQTTENAALKSDNLIKSQKVAIGSLLKPSGITVTGVKYKGNGKEVETNSAKKSEKLKFCFDVPDNQVADAGSKDILIRVINPTGATIAVESAGSGLFVVAGSGEQRQYTMKATFDYANTQKHICAYWKQTNPFSSGDYKVEFYQDGNLLNTATFKLK
jgi:myosin heavy subunit